MPLLLFHATPQHLIGCNKHNADDESNCKSAYQTLANTSLLDLLCRTGTCEGRGREREQHQLKVF